MALRDGKQYIESLRDGREVYIHGKRVEDVTKHPTIRKAIDHGVGSVSHIRDKIAQLIIYAETIRMFAKATAQECIITENEIAYPNPFLCNMGKYFLQPIIMNR